MPADCRPFAAHRIILDPVPAAAPQADSARRTNGSWWSWMCLMTSGLRAKRSPGVRAHHGPARAPVRVQPAPPIVISYHLVGWCMDGEQMGKLRLVEPPRK